MIYRQLGRTGLKVSQLGFGAMRLPMIGEGSAARVDDEKAVPMIRRAFEAGLNYIDTAVMYCNHDSQRAVGVALKGWRERVVVSTKNHYYDQDEKTWWRNLTDSLQRLDVQCIDLYNHHGVNWRSYTEKVEPRLSKWMRKARDQGLIKHICCSFHDNNEGLRKLVDSGYPSVITLQYNLLDRQLEDGIAHAHEKGVGIVVMGPVGGGRLGVDSPVLAALLPGVAKVPELALRFVLGNPHVSVALSGMSTMQQVEENLTTASDAAPLSDAERQAIREHLERLNKMADLYCTGCGYCKPCPQGVDIPGVFAQYNVARVYGLWEIGRRRYAELIQKHLAADVCADCGQCLAKCPQHLTIPEQLRQSHRALTGDDPPPGAP